MNTLSILNDDDSVKAFYKSKIQELEIKIKEKQLNFMRLQAQRNELNDSVLKLREEVKHLLKSSGVVAEVIKVLGKETVLVKTSSEGKLIVKIDKSIKIEELTTNTRVTLKSEEKWNSLEIALLSIQWNETIKEHSFIQTYSFSIIKMH